MVLRFPDLEVPQGARVLLRGASGTGKTSWLALVAGLLRPSRGRLVVAGQNLSALSQRELDRWRSTAVGLLPQRPHLSPALTVADNLALVDVAAGRVVNQRAIARVLQALGISHLGARRPSALSGGEAQRVALARAVLAQPRVLLADEPTSHLDDAAAQSALELLTQVAGEYQITLVVATHDRRVSEHLCDATVCDMGAPVCGHAMAPPDLA